MKLNLITLAIIAGLVLFGKYSTLLIADDITYTNVYMLCTTIAWTLLLALFRINVPYPKMRAVLSALTLLAFGEVLDEIFFDPIHIQWNEVTLLLIVSVWLSIKLTKLFRQ